MVSPIGLGSIVKDEPTELSCLTSLIFFVQNLARGFEIEQ